MKSYRNDFLVHTNFLTIMDDWKKSNETSLPEKEDFYSHLNIEDITDAN